MFLFSTGAVRGASEGGSIRQRAGISLRPRTATCCADSALDRLVVRSHPSVFYLDSVFLFLFFFFCSLELKEQLLIPDKCLAFGTARKGQDGRTRERERRGGGGWVWPIDLDGEKRKRQSRFKYKVVVFWLSLEMEDKVGEAGPEDEV